MRVIVYDYGAQGKVVDTTLSMASTLAPILERTHKSSGDIILDFRPGLVTGSIVQEVATTPESERTWTVRPHDRRLESIYYSAEPSRRLLGIDVHADSMHYHILGVSP